MRWRLYPKYRYKKTALTKKYGSKFYGTPNENRTRISALKGRCPNR